MITRLLVISLFLGSALFVSCTSVYDATNKSPEEIFARALSEFKSNDLFEAQRLFDIIRLQYPTSPLVDDAQYYLAEVNFRRREYILAAYNYNYVRRAYPQSEFAKESMRKAALCYVELSPPFDRDQKYTREAIVALTEFREVYPADSSFADSTVATLQHKLAERDFRAAEQYRVLYAPRSALVFYGAVIDEHPTSEFCEPSLVGKAEILLKLKRYDEALSACTLHGRFFPNGAKSGRIGELQGEIRKAMDASAQSKP
ncbi:MAG: outer membrane protein assembly factor BamD [Candidatus Kapaibacterium sp.]